MTSFDSSRKRKQDFAEANKASWSDYVHSPPPDSALDFSFDSIFSPLDSQLPQSAFDHFPSTRRHSVAVSDLGHMAKQEYDLQLLQQQQQHHWDAGFQHLFGTSMPSSWSSSASSGISSLGGSVPHQRAYSLHLDTSPHDLGAVSAASPTTPAFFSPSFLDALNAESDAMSASSAFIDRNMLQEHDYMMINQPAPFTTTTITPSVLSGGILAEQCEPLTHVKLEDPKPEKRRSKKTSPPTSPSHTVTSSISSSPSPPITPMQSTPFSVIPEEEDEDMAIQLGADDNHDLTGALKQLVQQYLLGNGNADSVVSGERTVMILTSKVAQKSYGTEKRFLCPPPTTILSGSSWWTTNSEQDDATPSAEPSKPFFQSPLNAPKLTIHISGEATNQSGVLEWYTSSGSILDASSSVIAASNASAAGDTTMCGKCVSKQLHINDADEKRKRVEVLAKIQLGNGIPLGTLASKSIKVISKPSKKRQSVKNLELCIHHGTTISLFNRIRSQTVSTKYLGVSNGQGGSAMKGGQGTCFVARTGSWDPFVIWVVDTSKTLDANPLTRNTQHPTQPHYPTPPAIALTAPSTNQQPIAIHYNQPVVLQCVATGLVSPVMVIRKVDKASMILGGNRVDDYVSNATGGECGDEALGDPVSQLHKVAFQIVQDHSVANNQSQAGDIGFFSNSTEWTLPQTCQPVTYLACLNDVVGMHKTTTPRTFVSTRPHSVQQPHSAGIATPASWSEGGMLSTELMSSVVSSQDDGKVTRKRRVSCDVAKPVSFPTKFQTSISSKSRRRVNSLNDAAEVKLEGSVRRGSLTDRRASVSSSDLGNQTDGACWTEDVSDASVWTIVGTDCATYTFWMPPPLSDMLLSPLHGKDQQQQQPSAAIITPFPSVSNVIVSSSSAGRRVTITGDNLCPNLTVWFGDVCAPHTDYKSLQSVSCSVPETELQSSPVATTGHDGFSRKVPILLVRDDGLVYRTEQFYLF